MHRKRRRKFRRGGMRPVLAAALALAVALSIGLAGEAKKTGMPPEESADEQTEHSAQRAAETEEQQSLSGDTETEEQQSLSGDTETEELQVLSEDIETEAETMDVFAPGDAVGRILSLSAGEVVSSGMVEDAILGQVFFASSLSDEVFARMDGISYTQNEFIRREDLSYLRMLYWDGQNTCVGEMVVNQKIEREVLAIFQALYENRYPIEKMVLIDNYGGDDEASMQDNNTSAFNYRTIAGSGKLSNHSYGMAIDLNPKYNPYVKTRGDGSVFCQPQGSENYADRMGEFAYKIDEGDLAYQLFTEAGFTWGGSWSSVKDYQHFEWEK